MSAATERVLAEVAKEMEAWPRCDFRKALVGDVKKWQRAHPCGGPGEWHRFIRIAALATLPAAALDAPAAGGGGKA